MWEIGAYGSYNQGLLFVKSSTLKVCVEKDRDFSSVKLIVDYACRDYDIKKRARNVLRKREIKQVLLCLASYNVRMMLTL